jgi:hypothetical protein
MPVLHPARIGAQVEHPIRSCDVHVRAGRVVIDGHDVATVATGSLTSNDRLSPFPYAVSNIATTEEVPRSGTLLAWRPARRRSREVSIRRLIASEFVTLDGVMEDMQRLKITELAWELFEAPGS